jgi:hypothetical protein
MATNSREIDTGKLDQLIAHLSPPADTTATELAAGQGVLRRGTVLYRESNGTYKAMVATKTASRILASDVDTTGETVVAEAYRTGHFAAGQLICGGAYVLTVADKEALRGVGILLSDTF